ncbi:MAG: LCP family protein [Clostridiales bacterium]|nr:LCP family protein [Clostridiales bacterium]
MVRRRKRKFVVFIIELVILALVVAALYFYQKVDQIEVQEIDEGKITVNELDEITAEIQQGYTTIAVFGLDNRSQSSVEQGNSDVIMLININNDTNEVSLVSVYRDTYLNVASASSSEYEFRKCNSAYAYGGVEQAITMLNRNLDLDIDDYITVDFQAVADAIDILGGVDIEIEDNSELKYLNQYITATNKILGTSSSQVSSVGLQHLDGVQAVAYTRIRYTSGGDFKRAYRQRVVIKAMMDEAKSANFSQYTQLIDAVFPYISTDMTQAQLLSMVQSVLNYDISGSRGFPFEKTTITISDSVGSVDVPCDLVTNVKELHEYLFENEEYTPSATVQEYSDYIIQMTGKTTADAINDEFSNEDGYEETEDITDTESEAE